ncbi:MAG: hypothetical protein KF849_01060 [Rhizobiaceae bacterium]|nr:hypothetical protein [Rhizobiaceae bacterium]
MVGRRLSSAALALLASISAETASSASLGEEYGSREPRTCADTSAPASGAITADLAKTYFECQAEGQSGAELYLVEQVKVQVGGGVPYTPNLGSFSAIDVNVPLYPIRGSYLEYQCGSLLRGHTPGANCATCNQPKATGYCYKTTFADWNCYMADQSVTERNASGVTPPQ